MPWIKLPNRFSGFFLVLHTGLLFFWLYNRLISNSDPISILLPVSISGLIVGCFMHYFVGNYLDIQREYRRESDIFNSTIKYWFFAIIVYIILISIISKSMQPVVPTPWMQPSEKPPW